MKRQKTFKKKRKIRKARSIINESLKDSKEDINYYRNIYINESLYNFNKNSKNELLNELINNLIEFRKLYFDNETNKSLTLSYISSNYLLYHHLEKNLIEIMYLPDKTRNEKILSIYKWYRNILNKNNCLKNINLHIEQNSINSYNRIDNNNYHLKEKNKEINNFEDNNKIQNEKVKKPFKKIKILSKNSIEANQNNKRNWDFMTHLSSMKNCSNSATNPKTDFSFICENIKKEEKQLFLPKLGSASKYSYSYNRPCLFHKNIDLENKIIKNKYELLSEKRSLESINKTINEFGINRAKLKENINNKHEIKKLITMYVNNESGQNLNLNITSPLLKKYKKVLVKPILKEKEKSTKNKSANNIYDKEIKKNNNNTIISTLKIKENKLINKDINKGKNNKINSYLSKKSNEIKDLLSQRINNIKKNNKPKRLFYGINHIKIYMDKIKNIDDKNVIKENKNMKIFDIKFKISEMSNKKIKEDNYNLNNLTQDIPAQLFTSEALFKYKLNYLNFINKLKNKDNEKDSLKKDEVKKDDLNNNNNENENKDSEQTESYYNPYYYNLSAFHINNLEQFSRKSRNGKEYSKYKCKSVDLNIKNKIELNENYKINKKNFLLMRKNMIIFKKRELEQLKNKIRNIKFKHNNRYDNIDDDKEEDKDEHKYEDKREINNNLKIKRNEILFKDRISNNKIDNSKEGRKKEYSLENALINPSDNSGFLLYYYPRPGTSLLLRK